MIDKFKRAHLFATLTRQPILFVENLYGDGNNYWFLTQNFVPYNPSNHIHYNEIPQAKCINDMFNSITDFDIDLFNTKLEEIPWMKLKFSNLIKWSMFY